MKSGKGYGVCEALAAVSLANLAFSQGLGAITAPRGEPR